MIHKPPNQRSIIGYIFVTFQINMDTGIHFPGQLQLVRILLLSPATIFRCIKPLRKIIY